MRNPHFPLSPLSLAFLAWGDFHACSLFAHSTIPEEKWGTTRSLIDLVTVFDAILTSRQMREKLYVLYENLMSNNFRGTAVLKKI